jgi:hypothetical protein
LTAEVKETKSYWTSGTNMGYGCEFTYGWCASKKLFTNVTWANGEPNGFLAERCEELYMSPDRFQLGVLNDIPCSVERNFICEVINAKKLVSPRLKIVLTIRVKCLAAARPVQIHAHKT